MLNEWDVNFNHTATSSIEWVLYLPDKTHRICADKLSAGSALEPPVTMYKTIAQEMVVFQNLT